MSKIQISDKKIYLKIEGDKISVKSNDCADFTNVRWQINENGRDWILLRTKEKSIDYLGPISYYVEAFCDNHLMMTAEDYRQVKLPIPERKLDLLGMTVKAINYEWDFTKLPEAEYNKAIQAYEDDEPEVLLDLHNTYKLSANSYCCGWQKIVKDNFKDAIESGKITRINQ